MSNLQTKYESVAALAARLGASQCVVSDVRSGRILRSSDAKHVLTDQLLGSPDEAKRLDASLADHELPSLWGQGADELMIFRPEGAVIVAFLFQSLSLSAVELFRFSKEVSERVRTAWEAA